MTDARTLDLQQAARDHLWLHFTRMGGAKQDVPVIVRGDGCYLEDIHGKRYLDALAGLFSVNIGYSFGEEIGQAALEQMRELPFYTNWSYSHPRAIELAAEVASLAPGDLNRIFFCSGGSEAVESAWKLARQYYLARGQKHLHRLVTPGARAGAQEPEVDHDAIVAAASAATAALQGDRPPPRIPRHDARCAFFERDPGYPDSVRAARLGSPPRAQHEPLPPPARGDGGRVHARSCSRISSRRSSPWGPTPCASSTWSRCRTRAAASRRRRATGAASARSARIRHPPVRR